MRASVVLVGSIARGFTAAEVGALSGVLAIVEGLPVAPLITEAESLAGDVGAGHGEVHVHGGECLTRFEVGRVGEVIDVLEHTRSEAVDGELLIVSG